MGVKMEVKNESYALCAGRLFPFRYSNAFVHFYFLPAQLA